MLVQESLAFERCCLPFCLVKTQSGVARPTPHPAPCGRALEPHAHVRNPVLPSSCHDSGLASMKAPMWFMFFPLLLPEGSHSPSTRAPHCHCPTLSLSLSHLTWQRKDPPAGSKGAHCLHSPIKPTGAGLQTPLSFTSGGKKAAGSSVQRQLPFRYRPEKRVELCAPSLHAAGWSRMEHRGGQAAPAPAPPAHLQGGEKGLSISTRVGATGQAVVQCSRTAPN